MSLLGAHPGSSPLWLELWRTAILLLGFTCIGQIVVLYRLRRRARYGNRRGELPTVGLISWALLIVFLIASIADRYGDHLTWRSPFAMVALGFAEYALYWTLCRLRGDGRGRASLR